MEVIYQTREDIGAHPILTRETHINMHSFVVVGDGAILESVGSFEGVRYNQLPRGTDKDKSSRAALCIRR